MINVLAYIGMNVRSEVCLWTLLGLIRTIFDATLFRVNANLKQVWQMSMPVELSMSVQRVLRTMISGVMLVQCFTVYVYLASYIVLLYPVFLEERPALVLPWLLLAAIRKLLCELTSLALGLGTCVLLGPGRPPCIKFLIIKVISIMPSFYMWMLLFSYYHSLKVATVFKSFPAAIPPGDQDYGLELAIRRRKTKSLLGEEQLRSKIVASLYGERSSGNIMTTKISKIGISSRMMHSTVTSAVDLIKEDYSLRPNSFTSNVETGSYEDWFGSEVILPRSCDRILEQFVLMLLRIKVYLDKEGIDTVNSQVFNNNPSHPTLTNYDNLNCAAISPDDAETPFSVGTNRNSNTASYLQEYPQIFMKKPEGPRSENKVGTTSIQPRQESEENCINTTRTRRRTVTVSSKETIVCEIEKVVTQRKIIPDDSHYKRKLGLTTSKETNSKEVMLRKAGGGIKLTAESLDKSIDQYQEDKLKSYDKENIDGNQGEIEKDVPYELQNFSEIQEPSTSDNDKIIEKSCSCSTDDETSDEKNIRTKNDT